MVPPPSRARRGGCGAEGLVAEGGRARRGPRVAPEGKGGAAAAGGEGREKGGGCPRGYKGGGV